MRMLKRQEWAIRTIEVVVLLFLQLINKDYAQWLEEMTLIKEKLKML
jgi:hypothetical protein